MTTSTIQNDNDNNRNDKNNYRITTAKTEWCEQQTNLN